MKIDCHVHLVGVSKESGCYLSKKMRRSIAYRFILWQLGLSKIVDEAERERVYVKQLASQIETSQIDRAVILAFDKVFNATGEENLEMTHTFVPNDYVADVCRKNPNFFLFGASVHPYRKDALDELDRVASKNAVFVKLLPNSQGFDPSNSRMIPYYRKMKQLDLPLLIHAGYEHTIPVVDQSFGFPERLRLALDEGLKVVVAHAGTSGLTHPKETMGETLKLLCDYPNCFCDTSALTNFWRSKYLIDLLNPERLYRKYGVEVDDPFSRMIHGSDYPIPITPFVFFNKLTRQGRKEIRSCRNPIEKDLVLKRLLGVPDSCLTRAHEELSIGVDPAER